MSREKIKSEVGILVEESDTLSIAKLCRYCSLSAEGILNMVELGVIAPVDSSISYSHWKFTNASVLRAQTALRLQRDLDINLAGAALALELLDELKQLRQQVSYLQR